MGVAEIDQRRDSVAAGARGKACGFGHGGSGAGRRVGFEGAGKPAHGWGLSGKLANDAFGEFLADAFGALDGGDVAKGDGVHQFGRRYGVENGIGRFARNAMDILKADKPCAFVIGGKRIERYGVFCDFCFDVQRGLFAD